ncbi:hypothetical protein [Streptomyces tanashiensis]|uniref:hypothetical protein n=1 Tax=Streptomyces tanashiensis TaxID=67367 RepID=UPI002B40036F|nr:hypothetical protein [Streptomyces tanashiensis]
MVNADLKRTLPPASRARNADQLADEVPLLPPPTEAAGHRPRLLPRPARPLHHRNPGN